MEQDIDSLIKKVAKRLVAYFQNPTAKPKIIVKVAQICGVKIPNEVNKKYGSTEP